MVGYVSYSIAIEIPVPTPSMNEHIRNKVYQLRTERGDTQEKLGEAVGVSRQTVIAIEKGNYTPSVLLAIKIARYFKEPVEKIFTITSR